MQKIICDNCKREIFKKGDYWIRLEEKTKVVVLDCGTSEVWYKEIDTAEKKSLPVMVFLSIHEKC